MEPDRITYSFGLKVNLGNYQSASVYLSYASDLKQGETDSDALSRITQFVEDNVRLKRDEVRSSYGNREDQDDL